MNAGILKGRICCQCQGGPKIICDKVFQVNKSHNEIVEQCKMQSIFILPLGWKFTREWH